MMAAVHGFANVRRTPAMGLGLPSRIIGRLSRNSVGTRRGRARKAMARENKLLARINRTRFAVAANARCLVLMEQPFRDAVRLGVLPAPRLFAGAPRSRCHPHPVSRDAGRIEPLRLDDGRCPCFKNQKLHLRHGMPGPNRLLFRWNLRASAVQQQHCRRRKCRSDEDGEMR